jgi:hypothetical protein
MTLREALHGTARCLRAFSVLHTFDATEIEVNALDTSGELRLRRALVLEPGVIKQHDVDQLASFLVDQGIKPAYNVELRALRGSLVIDRWCLGFFFAGIPARLERERGAGNPAI